MNDITPLVDESGIFYMVSVFIKRYKKGHIKKEDIVRALLAQYRIFENLCGKADYWNVHHNSSLDFKIYDAFAEVAHSLGLYKTSSFRRVYLKEKGILRGIKKKSKKI